MRGHRTSILAQIGGLALLIVLTVQAISVAVVLLTPPPPPSRMSPSTVREALLDPAVAQRMDWERRVVDSAPFGNSLGSGVMTAAGLAGALGLEADHVRVRTENGAPNEADAPPVTVTMRTTPDGQTGTTVTPGYGRPPLGLENALGAALMMVPQFTLPAFETAMRQQDGQWVVIGPREPWLSSWQVRVLASLTISLLVLAPLVWWAARRLTLPVRALARAAQRDDPDVVFPDAGPREVAAMAQALTTMRRRLIQQSEERMRMLAAVAHDLRTPLTGLRLRAETAPARERDRMAQDIDRMEAMIADVLAASGAATVGGDARPLDLGALCMEVVDGLDGSAAVQVDAGVTVVASPMRVRRALTNLIDNAFRYGGSAEVSLTSHDGRAMIRVADRGPGLSPEQAARAFEPFYRGEASRNRDTGGAGLGLTIAGDLAQADGGAVELSARDGGGLTATIRYPLADCGLTRSTPPPLPVRHR